MSQSEDKRSLYIVGPVYDWVFFLLPPVIALGLGMAISGTDFTSATFTIAGSEMTGASLFIGTIVHAHLVAVFVRSHGNPAIFRLYPIRFMVVPLLLWMAIASSLWLAISATVVATFWDVWHSGAQTFGFARIYDRNSGAPAHLGRKLDFWLNQLLYAGPILAGATLMDHVEQFENFESVGATFFTRIPAEVQGWQKTITWLILCGGTLFLLAYLITYWRLYRRGYRPSWLKVYLLVSTGACSIYTWGFNTWGEAFFIMNLFHAVQYLALIWATEQSHMMNRLGTSRLRSGRASRALTCMAFLGAVLAYGFAAELLDPELQSIWAVTMVVSLMHFWYDSFIWSVVKKQV